MTERDFTKLESRIRVALTEEAAIIPPLDAPPEPAHIPEDFDAFYAAQRGRLYRALVLSLRDRDLATEAVDIGMSRSFQRWRRIKKSGNADTSAYLAGFKWASKKTERSGGQHGFRLQRAERSTESVEAETAFGKLTVSDRSVVVARRYLGWDDAAVAAAHGVPPISVSRRFDAAINKIASDLGVDVSEADHRITHALRTEARDLVEPLGRADTVRGRAWLQRVGIATASAAAVLVLIGGGTWAFNSITEPETPPTASGTGLTGTTQPAGSTSQLATAAQSGEVEWSQVPLPITQGEISTVLSGTGGFVAFGQSWTGAGGTIALRSDDGFTWEELSVPLPQQAWIQGVNSAATGYLVTANAYDDRNGRESTLLLASEDGLTWQTYALPEAPDFVGGLNVYTYTSVNSTSVSADGSVSVTAYRGGDIENLDALIREVKPDFSPEFGWGSSPNGIDIYGEQGLVETIPWEEFDLDQEVIDVVSGSLVLWTADELGGEWTETKLSIPGSGRQIWVMGSAPVEGGFIAAVSGETLAGTLWRYSSATGEWTRVTLDGNIAITSLTAFNDSVVIAGSDRGGAVVLMSEDGTSWSRTGEGSLPEGTVERIVATPGGLAAVINRSAIATQSAVLDVDDYSITISPAGIYTVTDTAGTEIAQIFSEDAVMADGSITLVDPDSAEPIVSFTQRDMEVAWEQVWREVDQSSGGPLYDIAISADGTTWAQIDLDSATGGGFYPQSIAMDRGVLILSGYQEEGGGIFGRFEGQPSPVLWVATFAAE
jgi:DNA-directed RNA polymerase specialized sigma24 family protein